LDWNLVDCCLDQQLITWLSVLDCCVRLGMPGSDADCVKQSYGMISFNDAIDDPKRIYSCSCILFEALGPHDIVVNWVMSGYTFLI
jgi:hypothetical protein